MPRTRLSWQQRHETILEAAKKVFAEKGLAGARIRDIAEIAGINEGLIYRHFRSKEALFAEAARRLYDELKAGWQREAQRASSGREALKALAGSEISLFFAQPHVAASLLNTVASSKIDPTMRELSATWYREHQKLVTDLIRRGMEDGSLRQNLVPERAAMFLRGIIWMGLLQIVIGLEDNPDVLLKYVSEAIDSRIGPLKKPCTCDDPR